MYYRCISHCVVIRLMPSVSVISSLRCNQDRTLHSAKHMCEPSIALFPLARAPRRLYCGHKLVLLLLGLVRVVLDKTLVLLRLRARQPDVTYIEPKLLPAHTRTAVRRWAPSLASRQDGPSCARGCTRALVLGMNRQRPLRSRAVSGRAHLAKLSEVRDAPLHLLHGVEALVRVEQPIHQHQHHARPQLRLALRATTPNATADCNHTHHHRTRSTPSNNGGCGGECTPAAIMIVIHAPQRHPRAAWAGAAG
jgi:hypothetical protein